MNVPPVTVITLSGPQTGLLAACLVMPPLVILFLLRRWLGQRNRQGAPQQPVDWSIPTLDSQAEGQSLFHRWTPSAKIASLLLTSFLLASLHHLSCAAVGVLFGLIAVELAHLPWSRTGKRLTAMAGFLGMLVVIMPLTSPPRPGDTLLLVPLFTAWPLSLAGGVMALTIVGKAVAVALLMEPMLATAPLSRTLQGFSDLGLPAALTQMILLCHRYIFVFQQEMQRIQQSMQLRGFVPRTNLATLRALGNSLGMLFIHSFERTERVFDAMQSRGYQGHFPGSTRQQVTAPDLLKGAGVLTLGLILIIIDHLLPAAWY